MMLKAVWKKNNIENVVVVLHFLGGDEAMVRCVCLGEMGNPITAPFNELVFDMQPFALVFGTGKKK